MLEIEQKFAVDDAAALHRRLIEAEAVEQGPPQRHSDAYYNHPCRDFAQTSEALRVRRVDGVPLVTYKGAKLPGAIKARQELEWRLDPGDPDGGQMEQLLGLLGFRHVATVIKTRQSYTLGDPSGDMSITIDDAEQLGEFAEIELVIDVAPQHQDEGVEAARRRIGQLAERLQLRQAEPRSYLTMLLERTATEENI